MQRFEVFQSSSPGSLKYYVALVPEKPTAMDLVVAAHGKRNLLAAMVGGGPLAAVFGGESLAAVVGDEHPAPAGGGANLWRQRSAKNIRRQQRSAANILWRRPDAKRRWSLKICC
jgi:hypothetical protein